MHMFRTTTLLTVPALLLGALSAAPAEAAVTTSTGVRCTVVGTAGSDVLVGTVGRDVICGRGGNDVIRARGGDDLIDAGAGGDRVLAGAGDDRTLAAAGADRVDAGDGNDRVVGGDGRDQITGGDGRDSIAGGDGGDFLTGEGGVDTLTGGPRDDTLEGGQAGDDLSGQGGDDDLTGDGGADDLDGGVGTNICIVDSSDESVRCKYDEQPAVMVETRIDPGWVDVSNSSADVTVKVHATDDTGVEDVQVQLYASDSDAVLTGPPLELVSGTGRDGWWQATFEVSRWSAPGTLAPTVFLRDRIDRSATDDTSPARLQVLDENPDTQTPRLTLLSPVDPEVVDVRAAAADVTVSVRATDDLSGVGRVDLCLSRPEELAYQEVVCEEAVAKTSGTLRDGVWTTLLRIPKGAPNGEWNVTTYASDRARPDVGVRWMGPDAYKRYVDNRWCCAEAHPFPDDAGRLTVIGAQDSVPAWTDGATLSPAEVDTFTDEATTHVTVHALDADGEGVTDVVAVLVSDSDLASSPQFPKVGLTHTQGTLLDGTWEGDLTLPQGTPPGSYHVLVFVDDITHSTGYVGSGSAYASGHGYGILEGDPHVTVVEHQ